MATTARWETARQTLARAEANTGVRTRLPRTPPANAPARPSTPATPSTPARPARTPDADHVPVPAALWGLFPDGVLPRGSVTRIGGGMSVLFALAATAMGKEGWCAFVGVPDAGLAAAAGLGVALQRVVVVPETGAEAPAVLAALVDGVDVEGLEVAESPPPLQPVIPSARTTDTASTRRSKDTAPSVTHPATELADPRPTRNRVATAATV